MGTLPRRPAILPKPFTVIRDHKETGPSPRSPCHGFTIRDLTYRNWRACEAVRADSASLPTPPNTFSITSLRHVLVILKRKTQTHAPHIGLRGLTSLSSCALDRRPSSPCPWQRLDHWRGFRSRTGRRRPRDHCLPVIS